MTQEHPITPPPELVREWAKTCSPYEVPADHIATQAARWGADQELGASVAWLISNQNPRWALALQEGRRPKPPSLKEEALGLLDEGPVSDLLDHEVALIRRALESLPD